LARPTRFELVTSAFGGQSQSRSSETLFRIDKRLPQASSPACVTGIVRAPAHPIQEPRTERLPDLRRF